MSTSIDRTSLVRGAGTIKLGTLQFFDKGSISAEVVSEWEAVPVSGFGKIDDALVDQYIQASFNPSGRITAAILAALYPYGNPTIDASVFGATDTACELHSMAGKKLTLHNAALTRMPNLKLGPKPGTFAEGQITGLIKNSTARTAAAALYTLASEDWSGTIARAEFVRCSYTGTWGDGPGTTIVAKESWDVEFDLTLNPQKTDDIGTYDMTLGSLAVRAKCRPVNLSETLWDLMNLQNNAAAAIGSSRRASKDLVIASDVAGGITLTLKDAQFREGPLMWGEDELRAGEIGFEASRDMSGTTPGAIFTIAITGA